MTNFGLNFILFWLFKILILEFPVFAIFMVCNVSHCKLLYDTAVIKFFYTVPCGQRGDL